MLNKDILPEAEPSVQLSVLIVTYNSGQTIQPCITSLLRELSFISAEIIIVDNCSQDETVQILDSLSTDHPYIQIIMNRTNRGFAVGNNQALEQASGKHVLILNPDTLVHPGSLKGLLKELEANEKIGIVAPRLQFPDGQMQWSCRRFPGYLDVIYHFLGLVQLFPGSAHFNRWKMGDFDHQERREVDQPAGAALLIRGDLIRKLKGFDENFPMFFNDVDLCKRVKDAAFEIWYLPEYIVTHLGGASVKQVKVKMIISSHVSFFRYFEKHYTRLHQQPFNFMIGSLLYLSLIPRILFLLIFKNRRLSSRNIL